jgi:hypothetical protein
MLVAAIITMEIFMSNPTSHGVPISGVTADISDLAGNPAMLETVLGNYTTTLPFKFDFHESDMRHSFVMGNTRNGMSIMAELLTNEQK